MAKISTVNVITLFGCIVDSIESFTDDEEGNKEADAFFCNKLGQHGLSDQDIKDACDLGHYEVACGKEEYVLIHS